MKQIDRDKWIIVSINFTRSYLRGASIVLAIWAAVDWSLLLASLAVLCLISGRIGRNHGQQFEFRRIP